MTGSEFLEPTNRRGIERARRTMLIIKSLTERHTGDPMPKNYVPSEVPGVIGAVILAPEIELKTEFDWWDTPDDAA